MSKPKLRMYHSYEQRLTPEDQLALGELQEQYAKRELAEMARDRLAWSTNLVSDKLYRLCGCGCGVVFMSRFRKGEHIDPSELVADWREEPQEDLETFLQAPVEIPLKPVVSVAQVLWSRDVIAQYPQKTQEQICRENSISWEQLLHYAQSDTAGLPERKGQRPPTPKAQAKPATKPVKAKPPKKAKGA
jgi:hypothetical protein